MTFDFTPFTHLYSSMQNDKTRRNTGERTRGINRTCTVSEHFCGKRLLLLLIWRSGAELTNQLQIPRMVTKNNSGKLLLLLLIWRSQCSDPKSTER